MVTPRCVEHNSEMVLTRTEVAAYPDKNPVDFYTCAVAGCCIRYAEKLGGYGIWTELGKFVLVQEA